MIREPVILCVAVLLPVVITDPVNELNELVVTTLPVNELKELVVTTLPVNELKLEVVTTLPVNELKELVVTTELVNELKLDVVKYPVGCPVARDCQLTAVFQSVEEVVCP